MLKVKLSKVISYAKSDPEIFRRAWREFIGEEEVYEGMENFDKITALFNEWYIFDFRQKSGMNFITEYFLKNPDNLSQELLGGLKQIIETQRFEALEIVKLKRGEWLKAYGLYSGKVYQIYDHLGSLSAPDQGTLFGRVAKIDDHWQLVGSDSVFLSWTNTPRAKKAYLKSGIKLTAREVLVFWLPQKKSEDLEFSMRMTPKGLLDKRKELEKRFNELAGKNKLKVVFKDVLDFIYKENYQTNFCDFFVDLEKIGIPHQVIIEEMPFFNDLWNFFPHKLLKGKCPAEIYQRTYQEKYGN